MDDVFRFECRPKLDDNFANLPLPFFSSGLGTGPGSAMIVDGVLQPMLAHLPYKQGKTYEDYVGLRGLKLSSGFRRSRPARRHAFSRASGYDLG